MAVNVPPVSGMTPAEVAKELRVLMKKIVSKVAVPNAVAVNKDLTGAIGNVRAQREFLVSDLERLNRELDELVEIAKTRRPSEIRKKVESIKMGTLYNANDRLRGQTSWINYIEKNSAPPAVLPQTSPDLDPDLQRAYALAQSLPTVENATTGKEEQTIRAIKAIIKVHEGIDPLGTFGDVSMPDIPLVLVHEVEKIATSTSAISPFTIGSEGTGTYAYNSAVIVSTSSELRNASSEDGIGDPSAWNGGNCSLEEAADTFRSICNRYNSRRMVLRDRNGIILARRSLPGKPISWMIDTPKSAVLPVPSLA